MALLFVERSNLGKVFVAIRDNENVVRSLGIPVFMTKVLCFAVASADGLAGSVHAYASNVTSPLDFGSMLSTFALGLSQGGRRGQTRWGPSSGRCCSWGSPAMRRPSEATSTFYGLAIIVSVLFMPRGLMGLFKSR